MTTRVGSDNSYRAVACLVAAGLAMSGVLFASPALPALVTCDGLPATIVGTEGNDTITGTDAPDVIASLGGPASSTV